MANGSRKVSEMCVGMLCAKIHMTHSGLLLHEFSSHSIQANNTFAHILHHRKRQEA